MNDLGRRLIPPVDDMLSTLERALARAGDGVCVVGPNGRIVFWNRAAEKVLGYTARDAVGRRCCDVFAGLDGDGNRVCYEGCHVTRLLALGESVRSFDMKSATKAGPPAWINVSTLRVDGKAGAGYTIHLFRDVTSKEALLTLVDDRRTATADGAPGHRATSLSRRELDVLRLLAAGLNTRAAAERLHVSPATIRNHVQNLLGKLGVHSRLEAVAYATRHRLL